MSQPFVSILTPTYNRRRFLPSLIECYLAQDYPLSRMEWIILDDGEDCVKDVFDGLTIPNVRYIRLKDRLLVGAKRNLLNREAKGSILIAMDDDDYYTPKRVSHVVKMFAAHPKIQVAGSSELYLYYTDTKKIFKFGPYGEKHATNGTMAWRKEYAHTHSYDETIAFAEERSFLQNYTVPMIQLDPLHVMLVMSHSDNTYSKAQMRDGRNPFVKETPFTLSHFISSPTLRTFYESA
jgi:glycosyltransferase involved in cell wall biosynthesis